MIDLPRHAAYPSGHSTQLHPIAHVVHAVTGRDGMKDAFMHFADEAPHFLALFKDQADEARAEWA